MEKKKEKQQQQQKTKKKTLLKFVRVTQAASCCSIQAFDLNDMAIDPFRMWTTKPMKQTEINSAISPFYSIYLPNRFFIYEWTKLFNFHGRFEQPMINLQAHQRL